MIRSLPALALASAFAAPAFAQDTAPAADLATPAMADQAERALLARQTGLRTIRVTYTNLTSGQIFSPSAFASHNALAPAFFTEGAKASFGLQRMAEEGNTGPTFSGVVLPNRGKLFLGAASALSAFPGQSRSITIRVSDQFPLISAYWMLVRTNDGFTGLNAVNGKTLESGLTLTLFGYDAGTELNTEQSRELVALEGSGRSPTNNVVRAHPGLRTKAADPRSDVPGSWDFNPAQPVARVTFTVVE